MNSSRHEQTTAGLVRQFQEVLKERDRLNVELVRVLAAIRAIAGLPGNEGVSAAWIRDMAERIWNPKPSLAAGVRMTLELSKKLLTPPQIKEELVGYGYDLRKYSFSIAGIHSALKSLMREGSVEQRLDPLGRKAYRWRPLDNANV